MRDESGHRALTVAVLASILIGVTWSYWSTLERMAERWASDPQYSHGFVVPVLAGAVLWSRRQRLTGATWAPSWWGLTLLLPAVGLRLFGASIDFEPLDAVTLVPLLAGLTLLVGGWSFFRWACPAILFLAFMVPLPFRLETALGQPLRRIATACATYVLQTLGYPAVAEGNVIVIEQLRLGVIEACSGLGMLATFFALATALALMIRRPLVDRLVLVASAAPIAVAANVARITATAVVHDAFGSDVANAVFHDLAGWLMMPLALLLMWLELTFLAHVLVPMAEPKPLGVGISVEGVSVKGASVKGASVKGARTAGVLQTSKV